MFATNCVLHNITYAFGADHVIGHVLCATVLLPTVGKTLHALGVFEDNGVMVKDVAVLRLDANLPTPRTSGSNRILVLHCPCHLFEAVHMFLAPLIARPPTKVKPH